MHQNGEDCTLMIRQIEIANPNKWSASAKMEDYIEHNHVTTQAKRLFSFASSDNNKR